MERKGFNILGMQWSAGDLKLALASLARYRRRLEAYDVALTRLTEEMAVELRGDREEAARMVEGLEREVAHRLAESRPRLRERDVDRAREHSRRWRKAHGTAAGKADGGTGAASAEEQAWGSEDEEVEDAGATDQRARGRRPAA